MVTYGKSRVPFDSDAAASTDLADTTECTSRDALAARDLANYRAGYEHGFGDGYSTGLREGLNQGPNHPAVSRSVANMFGDWDGAQAAHERSTQRFWRDYRAGDEQ